ncbi:MAG TPA: tetratricopeptide repeat protein [Lacunisphaera sp.]|nr:tetratricopeptide repeat protein [Lacunisphaera sp.]
MYEANAARAELPALVAEMRRAHEASEQAKAAEVAAKVLMATPNDPPALYVLAVARRELDYAPALAAYRAKFPDLRTPEARAAWRELGLVADRVIAPWARVAVHAIKPGEEKMRAEALGRIHALVDAFHRGSLFAPANALARARLGQKEGESLADDRFPDPNDPAHGGVEFLRGLAAGQDGDYPRALVDIRAAIAKNNAAAMDWMAGAYLDGWGVEKSVAMARHFYLRAIVHGFGASRVLLQLIDDPISGNQVPEFDRAVLASRAGNTQGARAEYAQAAEKGSVEAMARVAEALKAEDPAAAVGWWRRAVDRGHVEAMRQLGLAYRDGRGVTQDAAEARAWLGRAAEQGSWDAAAALQNMGRKDEG